VNPSSPPPPRPDPLAPLRPFPHWEVWRGVSGLWYARRRKTSPPPVLRAENTTELARLVLAWEAGDRTSREEN
jgi:hypothetical protein